MAPPLPDPTPSEAKALLVGTGIAWLAWGVAVAGLVVIRSPVALLAAVFFIPGGLWAIFGGAYPIAERAYGSDIWPSFVPSFRRARAQFGLQRVMLPGYLRRAARALGWPERAVIGTLAALLGLDLALFVVMVVTLPGNSHNH